MKTNLDRLIEDLRIRAASFSAIASTRDQFGPASGISHGGSSSQGNPGAGYGAAGGVATGLAALALSQYGSNPEAVATYEGEMESALYQAKHLLNPKNQKGRDHCERMTQVITMLTNLAYGYMGVLSSNRVQFSTQRIEMETAKYHKLAAELQNAINMYCGGGPFPGQIPLAI